MGRVLVVLNAQAGTVRDVGAAQIRARVDEALTLPNLEVDVEVLEGEPMVHAIASASARGYDTLIVGAGDGTVSHAAAVLSGTQVTLGVLPLGTMNMLAYDIGLPRDLTQALEALRHARPMRIDLATVNGRAFHGVSGLGFFTQMAMAREQVRAQRGRVAGWLLALGRAVVRSGRLSLVIEIEGQRSPVDAYAAIVTNNAFDAPGWHRSRLDAGVLEVHVAEERGALARIRAGADLLAQAWRDNPGIHTFRTRAVTIHAPRRHRAWVATDGEISRETLPLHYEVAPGALSLLLPPDAPQWAGAGGGGQGSG